jgi:FSR family fosmidomycin resistance protein-like MFS transporter
VASGFILGMGFVTGGIGAPITGVVADDIGTGPAIMLMAILIVAAAAIAARIPRVALQPARAAPAPEPAT